MIMKKLLLSFLSAFLLFTLSAQVTDDFSDYTVGGKLAQQAQAMGRDYWTTWSSAPGGIEDGVIAEMSGNKVLKLDYPGVENDDGNDQVLKLGGKTSSTWELSLKIFVPTGQCGYFNIVALFAGAQSKWAFQVYFNKDGTHPGVGTMDAGGSDAASFTFAHDSWIPVKLIMNLDANLSSVYINDALIHSWIYTDGSFGPGQSGGCPRIIDGMDFYPPTKGKSTFYIDDVNFELFGDPTFPILDVTPPSVYAKVAPGDAPANIPISITNTGTSIGDYLAWVNFGEGEEGATKNYSLTYSTDALGSSVSFTNQTENTWVEIASKFPVSYFCDKIGTYLTKLSYYVPTSIGSDPIIFKIYGPQVDNTGPGELLLQTSLNTYTIGAWNTVTLPEPFLLDGREIWISAHFTYIAGITSIACDGAANFNGINWSRHANYSWSDFGSEFGDFMLKGTLEGKTTPACWFTIPQNNYGSVLMGATKDFNIVLNPAGLEIGEYKATLFVETNDDDHPRFEIPVTFVIADQASNNAELDNLTADGIVAQWNSAHTFYYMPNFKTTKNEVEIIATPQHEAATVAGAVGIQPIKSGNNTYDFTITAEDGTTVKEYRLVIVATIEGITEIENIVKLYPNPVIDNLYLDIQSGITINQAFIYDFTGKMVKLIEQPGNIIHLSDLPTGNYMMKVTTSEGEATHKFIKK